MKPMLAASLDLLERAQVPSAQARAILQVLDLEFEARTPELATKPDLKQEMTQMRHELELKLESVKSELVRWVFVCILGQTAVLLGGASFLLDHWRR